MLLATAYRQPAHTYRQDERRSPYRLRPHEAGHAPIQHWLTGNQLDGESGSKSKSLVGCNDDERWHDAKEEVLLGVTVQGRSLSLTDSVISPLRLDRHVTM